MGDHLVLVCGLAVGSAWAAKLKIGMVFDVGGKGDQSFNDSAYRGLQWASKLDISHVEIEPGADRPGRHRPGIHDLRQVDAFWHRRRRNAVRVWRSPQAVSAEGGAVAVYRHDPLRAHDPRSGQRHRPRHPAGFDRRALC